MPTDPVKTLVWKDGSMDNMGGLTVRPVPAPGAQWLGQQLLSPRVPIVLTHEKAGDLDILEEAFVSPVSSDAKRVRAPLVQRVGGSGTVRDWASPDVPCEAAFRRAATGRHEVVHYRFQAKKGRSYTLVLGFCEGANDAPGDRVLDIEIENKRRRRLDLAAEFGRYHPVLIPIEARDEDGDGLVDLAIAPVEGCKDGWGLLNVLWVFEGKPTLDLGNLLLGKSSVTPLAHVACGDDQNLQVSSPSVNIVSIRLRNTGSKPVESRPEFAVGAVCSSIGDNRDAHFAGWTATCFEPNVEMQSASGSTVFRFRPEALQPGQERTVAVTLWRNAQSDEIPRNLRQVAAIRRAAESYWRRLRLPYDRIQVPDSGIQSLVDASLREIYQNRDYKNGTPVYQVGPTIYRDVSCVDGSFFCELGLFLGLAKGSSDTLDYFLTCRRANGRMWVYTDFWKENGLIPWAMVRYALLTGDHSWLERRWSRVEGMVGFIEELRRRSKQDPKALNYGLIPDGYGDGGNGGVSAEYSNVLWCYAGLKAAIQGARLLHKADDAARWRRDMDEMGGYLRAAMRRDTRKDRFGNLYLPNLMGSDGTAPPARGQYAFLQSIFPGQVQDDRGPLVLGTLAMLEAAHVEGLPLGAGWVTDGVWPYFSSLEADALQWVGQGPKSVPLLYAIANHAAPVFDWWEEQQLQDKGKYLAGDMPHNWGSVEFIRQVRYMLAMERGSELHLLEGLPAAWAKPGMTTRMKGVLTEFGPLSLELSISADGRKAILTVEVPSRVRPSRVVVHLDGWAGPAGVVQLPTEGKVVREIDMGPSGRQSVTPSGRVFHEIGEPVVEGRHALGVLSAAAEKSDAVLRHRVLVGRLVSKVDAPPNVVREVGRGHVNATIVE